MGACLSGGGTKPYGQQGGYGNRPYGQQQQMYGQPAPGKHSCSLGSHICNLHQILTRKPAGGYGYPQGPQPGMGQMTNSSLA